MADTKTSAEPAVTNRHGSAFAAIQGGGNKQFPAALLPAAPDIILEDRKTQNTGAGTFTSGADQTRTLNTETRDINSECSLSSNQFTLTAGTYYIDARAPAYGVNRHQIFLYNVTDATEIARGSPQIAGSADDISSDSVLKAVFTVGASKALELRHRCQTTRATNGLGIEGNFGQEIYAQVLLWRVS